MTYEPTCIRTHAGPLGKGYLAQILHDTEHQTYAFQVYNSKGCPVGRPWTGFQNMERAIEAAHQWQGDWGKSVEERERLESLEALEALGNESNRYHHCDSCSKLTDADTVRYCNACNDLLCGDCATSWRGRCLCQGCYLNDKGRIAAERADMEHGLKDDL